MRTEEPEETEAQEEQSRAGHQKAMPWLAFVAIAVVPVLLALTLPGSTVTAVLLVYLPVVAFVLGLIDAVTFRPTGSFPLLAGTFFLVSSWMFYNDGAWIYALVVAALAAAGGALARLRRVS
ncbi:hypothetical protein [Corynebacterium sp.]|uniref:hypothetical protein n=1 Tax=Corynebacterium sp. TaxID=1720 RepID=UPI002A911650|nr:hypothetical protein [Corynebacterium sp.]MDY5784858.1 hypothetical protein [Corynebacterium sp.]